MSTSLTSHLPCHAARSGRLRAHRLRRDLHRLDDPLVTGAATEVAREPLFDLVEGGVRVVLEERLHAHHEARRAETALQAVGLAERLLHRAERAVGRTDALDGGDVG